MAERGLIPQDTIEEIRARTDIVDIVGEIVSLKKAGREYKARCPFHDEKTPSFTVVPDKGFYKCFGCGKTGDAFNFVMEQLGMDFVEAVEYVAGRVGVEIRREARAADPNAPFYEITAFAQTWFREQLLDETVGRSARDYLVGRGIGLDVAERFGLGFAPDEWRAFRDAASKHGFDEDDMKALGLLKQSEKSKEPYDGFRGRIMFPIESVGGKTIAFGGRILEGSGPKYINSPETPIYEKGKNLYGLSWAKHQIRKEEKVLVVEGYMDVVSLAAAGVENVVAPLGTALTEDQAARLVRYTKKVILLFDSDRAGLAATFKAGDVLLAAGAHPGVVTLPDGEDPDTLVQKQGVEALRELIAGSADLLDRKLQILREAEYFSSLDRTRRAVDKLLPTLRATADPALRDMYVGTVAEATGVRAETLESEIRKAEEQEKKHKYRQSQETPRAPSNSPRPSSPRRPGGPTLRTSFDDMGAESQLLKVLVRGAEWVERAAELISPGDFEDPRHRAIFEALLDDPERRAPPADMDAHAAARFDEIRLDPEELAHGGDVFTESVNRLRVLALVRKVQDVQAQIVEAEDEEEGMRLMARKTELAAELRELDPNYWSSVTRRGPDPYNPSEPSR